jgi:hypothetical protein
MLYFERLMIVYYTFILYYENKFHIYMQFIL